MSETKHGNPMVRCPEGLHPLVKEFARLYRSGNQDKVLEALQHALATLSTGAVTPVSSQDVSNVLVDVLNRLNRIEKAVFPQVTTSDNSNVDIILHTGDSTASQLSTPNSDNGLMHTGDNSNALQVPTPSSVDEKTFTPDDTTVSSYPVDPVGRRRLLEEENSRSNKALGALIQQRLETLPGSNIALSRQKNFQAKVDETRSQLQALQQENFELKEQQNILVEQKLEFLVAAKEADAEIEQLRQEVEQLRSQPVKTPKPPKPKKDTGGWLTRGEAYKIALERGYEKSIDSFSQGKKEEKYAELGFEVDFSRRIHGVGADGSRWLKDVGAAPVVTAIAEPESAKPLLQRELAKRLRVNETTLWRVRQTADFVDWCRERDPDGITWEHRPAKKGEPQYYPLP